MECFVSRSLFLLFLLFILLTHCNQPDLPNHYVVLHQFQHAFQRQLFGSGLSKIADSLDVNVSLLNLQNEFSRDYLDSLSRNVSGVSYSASVNDEQFGRLIKKNRGALIQFHQPDSANHPVFFIDSDAYTAGLAAARFVVQKFGENGRFGIITTSLNNHASTESIRGFREELLTLKSDWKQINIITCGQNPEQALKQYRYATRFGNRIIWFVANNCEDFLKKLKNLKKDNFFIAIDLHPNKNNIKLLQEEWLDAVATKDFENMGRLCLINMTGYHGNPGRMDDGVENCGSMVLTQQVLAKSAQQQ